MESFLSWSYRNQLNESNESQPRLLQIIEKHVKILARTNPFLNRIVSDKKEFEEFLMSVIYVIKGMSLEQRKIMVAGPKGIEMLLNKTLANYISRKQSWHDENKR